MSCDFAVWYPQTRLKNREAGKLYARLCDSDTSGVTPNSAIDAFYVELTSKHPEIDTIADEKVGDFDYCPWSSRMDRSAGHLILSCVWPKAGYVGELVQELARKHGLAFYDPQSVRVTYPDGATGATPPSVVPRWILGFFALLFAALFVYSERLAPSNAPWLLYAFAGLCVLLAVSCFRPRKREMRDRRN